MSSLTNNNSLLIIDSLHWPIVLSIVGHVNYVRLLWSTLCLRPQLAKHYGNVYSLYIGPKPAVVVNGLQALKEAFVTKAADFSGRPQDQMVNHAIMVKGCGASFLSFFLSSDYFDSFIINRYVLSPFAVSE